MPRIITEIQSFVARSSGTNLGNAGECFCLLVEPKIDTTADMLCILAASAKSDSILDLAQTVVSLLALLVAVYAVVRQKREMAKSSKLNAAATLFDYYNAKISSLRKSIIRDSGGPEQAELQPLAERQTRLKKLLKTHEKMLSDLEGLYARMPGGDED